MILSLLVDIGNTAIKWTWLKPDSGIGTVEYRIHAGDVVACLEQNWASLKAPSAIWVANVADDHLFTELSRWVATKWSLTATRVHTESSAFGVTTGYRDHRLLGVDRWLAMIAAYRQELGAVCVVDCGTAATIDAITPDGSHLGGYIVPGVGSSRRALLDFTRIPRVDQVEATTDFGIDTATAVELGGRHAVVGVIRHCMNLLEEQGYSPRLYLAGSEGELLRPWLPEDLAWRPDLVLEGLAHYARNGD